MGDQLLVWVTILAVVVILAALSILDTWMLPIASDGRHRTLLSGASAVAGAAAWSLVAPLLAVSMFDALYWPAAALGGLAAYLASIAIRGLGVGSVTTVVFALIWTAIVYTPVAAQTLVGVAPFALPFFRPIDHGGSLAVNVAAGAGAATVLLVGGRRCRSARIGLRSGVVAVIALYVGWMTWLIGAEGAVDGATGVILVNSIVGSVAGVVGWLSVQRIRHQVTTLNAVAAGVLCGLVAVTGGAPLFTPVSAAVAGVLAGGLACIFTLVRVRSDRRQQWYIVGSHLVAGATGLVIIGLAGNGVGFIFTGSVGFLMDQMTAVVSVALYSAAVTLVVWLFLRRGIRARNEFGRSPAQ